MEWLKSHNKLKKSRICVKLTHGIVVFQEQLKRFKVKYLIVYTINEQTAFLQFQYLFLSYARQRLELKQLKL